MIKLFQEGSRLEKEFENLYTQHYQTVVKVAYTVLHDSMTSQDIASEVFLKLFESLLHKKDIQNIKAWLIIVAKYTAYDYLRDKNKEVSIERFENSLHTSDFTDDLYTKLYTDTILKKLYQKNKRWHDICLLHYLLGMSIREIAEMYNCSESSISNALYRAKRYLTSQNTSLDFPCIVILFIVAGISLS